MKKVLVGFVSDRYGGISQYLYNTCKHIDKTKVKFDFLYIGNKPGFANEFEDKGTNFYKVPKIWKIIDYYFFLRNLYNIHSYEYIYFNFSFANFLPVVIAKLIGYRNIICHAHATGLESNEFKKNFLLNIYAMLSKRILQEINIKNFFACSLKAGVFTFGKEVIKRENFKIIKNAIDTKSFEYDDEYRKTLREYYKIKDSTLVIGHVGRFEWVKNHKFLVDVFYNIVSKYPDTKLLLIGDGSEKDNIEKYVTALNLKNKVIFLGNRNDVNKLISMMDCFVMPSKFEGFGLAAIEAQANGLVCFFSDAVPRETCVLDSTKYLSLDIGAEKWADVILNNNMNRTHKASMLVEKAGFELKAQNNSFVNIFI